MKYSAPFAISLDTHRLAACSGLPPSEPESGQHQPENDKESQRQQNAALLKVCKGKEHNR
jgi:hypothetical protein